MDPEELACIIDHTELSPSATESSLKRLCEEAKSYQFRSVCVNPHYVKFCVEQLKWEEPVVDATVGFPLGQNTPEEKTFETKRAVREGAEEIDMVMNIEAFKDGKYDLVKREIEAVANTAEDEVIKVIIESGYLTYEEIIKASEIVKESGANFVKNATGFGPYGANIPHIWLMRRAVGDEFGVKAAGGIRDFRDAFRMIAAGANRIGTSSGPKIIDDLKKADHTSWIVEENPCRLCPGHMIPTTIRNKLLRYYKSRCDDCPHGD